MAGTIDRRGLLKMGAFGVGGVAAGALVARLNAPRSTTVALDPPDAGPDRPRYDVAIVGGGVSGIYSGWRLRGCDGSAPPSGKAAHPRVAVFEKSIHVLGRIRSVRLEGADRPGELGAMRYMPQRHRLVRTLVEDKLGLETRPFEVGDDANLLYVRGRRFTNRQVAKTPKDLPYNVWPSERGQNPDDLASRAIEALLPGATKFTAADWERARDTPITVRDQRSGELRTVSLSELGLVNALALTLSKEAARLVTDAGGYDSAMVNLHALEGLHEWVEDGAADVTYRAPKDGMAAIPNALRSQYQAQGGELELGHTLRRIDYDRAAKAFVLLFDVAGGQKTVLAEKVILAMPQTPLREVVRNSSMLSATPFAEMVEAVTPIPMTRVLSSYESAWWEPLGITSGRTVSDLPLRQLYYFGAKPGSRPFVMGYTDGAAVDYLAGYEHPEDPGAPKHLSASSALVDELRTEMSEIHGRSVPAPMQTLAKRWASESYGGAYHVWNPGVRTRELAEAMLEPLRNVKGAEELPLYVTGEAFSRDQGWVEGALATAEDVLAKLGKTRLAGGRVSGPVEPAPVLPCLECHTRKGA